MNGFLVPLLGALLATNPVTQVSNLVARTTGVILPVIDPNDPVERELRQLMEEDDNATADVDRWLRENDAEVAKGNLGSPTLNLRTDDRLKAVEKAYENFVRRHPEHARARLAYGSFLNDTGRTDEALEQWEKSRDLDPRNPAVWNNLAEVYVHRSPVTNIFVYLGKATELAPREPVYYRNLATAVSLYRLDAAEFYHLADDQAVLRRALELYRKAREYDPANLPLATDLAQTYYFVKPVPTTDPQQAEEARRQVFEEGMAAWRDAEKVAKDEVERQGIYLHLARYCRTYGRVGEAREWLLRVDKPEFQELKKRLTRSLDTPPPDAKPAPSQPVAD